MGGFLHHGKSMDPMTSQNVVSIHDRPIVANILINVLHTYYDHVHDVHALKQLVKQACMCDCPCFHCGKKRVTNKPYKATKHWPVTCNMQQNHMRNRWRVSRHAPSSAYSPLSMR